MALFSNKSYELISVLSREFEDINFVLAYNNGLSGRVIDRPTITINYLLTEENDNPRSKYQICYFLTNNQAVADVEEKLGSVLSKAVGILGNVVAMTREGISLTDGYRCIRCVITSVPCSGEVVTINQIDTNCHSARMDYAVDTLKIQPIDTSKTFERVISKQNILRIFGVNLLGFEGITNFTLSYEGEIFSNCNWRKIEIIDGPLALAEVNLG